ncbi:metal-sensitive transcriptional regulator [Sunxiuqinia indica]|uniref:hypothetical protein n=1 Tax=Sunxiuqinia indica TaxID=2692584 RepID=UPI001357EC52|nr:hypothetical protein [Sunxiuqinia indica]
MGEWSQKITAGIEQELSGTKDSDLRFLRVAEYLRMVKRVDEFSKDCDQCQQFQKEIEQQLNTISSAVNNTGKDRRNYDRHIDRLARHMKKEHGFYPPFFYRYSLSFFYTLVGGVSGLLTSFFFSSIDRWFFIIPPLVVGLLVGQFIGGQKDARIRANKKIL